MKPAPGRPRVVEREERMAEVAEAVARVKAWRTGRCVDTGAGWGCDEEAGVRRRMVSLEIWGWG